MQSYAEIAESLTASLALQPPPVAVCFADKVRAGVAHWCGAIPAGCRFWRGAASRVCGTSAADHERCSSGQYTHALDMSPASQKDLGDALRVFAGLTYVREQDI